LEKYLMWCLFNNLIYLSVIPAVFKPESIFFQRLLDARLQTSGMTKIKNGSY
jgi:hypothetical protein